jgi:hypothetical protein
MSNILEAAHNILKQVLGLHILEHSHESLPKAL